jgi:hypothetical protein
VNASSLLDLACRCLTAANESLDNRSKEEFREIARELILIADEFDHSQQFACVNKHH